MKTKRACLEQPLESKHSKIDLVPRPIFGAQVSTPIAVPIHFTFTFPGERVAVADLHHGERSDLEVQTDRQYNVDRGAPRRCARVGTLDIY